MHMDKEGYSNIIHIALHSRISHVNYLPSEHEIHGTRIANTRFRHGSVLPIIAQPMNIRFKIMTS